jgi:hypothetical protein
LSETQRCVAYPGLTGRVGHLSTNKVHARCLYGEIHKWERERSIGTGLPPSKMECMHHGTSSAKSHASRRQSCRAKSKTLRSSSARNPPCRSAVNGGEAARRPDRHRELHHSESEENLRPYDNLPERPFQALGLGGDLLTKTGEQPGQVPLILRTSHPLVIDRSLLRL